MRQNDSKEVSEDVSGKGKWGVKFVMEWISAQPVPVREGATVAVSVLTADTRREKTQFTWFITSIKLKNVCLGDA